MDHIEHPFKDLVILIRANLWLIPVIAALIAAMFYFVAPPPPMSVAMATGAEGGGYAASAGKLRKNFKEQGFELKLIPNTNSRDSLERLLGASEADIALVQSGQKRQLEAGQTYQLQTLSAAYQEPLWLFHRSNVHINQFSDLLHPRLAIGSNGSGTCAATEVILRTSDITPGHYPVTWETRDGNAVVDDLLAGRLDAAFIVGPAENPAIQRLANNDQLRLINFRRSAAYKARLLLFKRAEVGRGLLNLPRSVPERNISTLSPVATLVINERFHPVLIPSVLEIAHEVMKDGSLLDEPGASPSAEPRILCLHEDTECYYKSDLPLLQCYLLFCIASLVDRYIILLVPSIATLIPLIKFIDPLYRWYIRARIYRWYRYAHDIDHKLDGGTDVEQLRSEIERLEKLESELNVAEVPPSYHHELYELHLHLSFVTKCLHGLQERQATQTETGSLG